MGRHATEFNHSITQLKYHHMSMARDVALAGLRNVDLAKIYGMLEPQISLIVNSPLFMVEVARLQEMADEHAIEVREDLRLLSPKAVEIMKRNLYEETDNLKVRELQTRTAFSVLDRTGYGVKEEGSGRGSINLTQVNINARKLSTDELRDSVMELVEESE